jgi:Ca2+:H+ antiporter
MDERLSLGVSAVLLLLYAANLVYTLVTHRDVFAGDAPQGEAEWSVSRAVVIMAADTAVIAIEAELVSAALEATSDRPGPVVLPRRDLSPLDHSGKVAGRMTRRPKWRRE